MGLSLSMMRREQARQMQREQAARSHVPQHLTGIKRQVEELMRGGAKLADMITYDCTVCAQRFAWEQGKPLDACPLCGAGAKQRPNTLPSKRLTHRQRRERWKAARAKEAAEAKP